MNTRKEYLNHDCTFAEYYGQFVDSGVMARVLHVISLDELTNSNDEHLNDIELSRWDAVLAPFPKHIGDQMRECGDFPTMAGAVCIAKEAARQLQA